MNGFVEVVATNSATEHLKFKRSDNAKLYFADGIHILEFLGQKYLFNIRQSMVGKDNIVFYGLLSDDKSFVGNICIEFVPKIS